tara:strand:+ start:5443 stop:6198 length:756 start_codon:yes stop_codon:yes gene_type:complete
LDKIDLSNRSIAFDFDGVICDSQYECFKIAYKAFNAHQKNDKVDDIFFKKNLHNFYKLRPFVYSGEDYVLIIYIILSGMNVNNVEDFQNVKRNQLNKIPSYRKSFYSIREKYQNKNINEWISLNKIYPKMHYLINQISLLTDKIYIVTTKDLKSVRIIKDYFSLNIKDKNIFSVSSKMTKEKVLINIMNDNKHKSIYFLEDRLDTLVKIKNKNINRLLANWGYNSEIDKANAVKQNIMLVSMDEITTLFIK